MANNGCLARKLAFGDGWTKVALGIAVQHAATADASSESGAFGLGLCSGDSRILGDATTDHWVGVYVSFPGGWSSGNQNFVQPNPIYAARKVGSTLSLGDSMGNYRNRKADSENYVTFCATIEKTGSNEVTIGGFAATAGNLTGQNYGDFKNAIQTVTPPSGESALTEKAIYYNPANGVLNHFNFAWMGYDNVKCGIRYIAVAIIS